MSYLETLRNIWLGLTTTAGGKMIIVFAILFTIFCIAMDIKNGREATNERCKKIRERGIR